MTLADSDKNRPDQKKWPLVALVLSTALCLGVSIYYLQMQTSIVFQNLYYFPILIACSYFQKKGFLFSVLLSFIYFSLIMLYTPDPQVIVQALIRVMIFIIIAGVITVLSQMNKEKSGKLAEKESLFRGLFDTMPSGSAILRVSGRGEEETDYRIEDLNATGLQYEGKKDRGFRQDTGRCRPDHPWHHTTPTTFGGDRRRSGLL